MVESAQSARVPNRGFGCARFVEQRSCPRIGAERWNGENLSAHHFPKARCQKPIQPYCSIGGRRSQLLSLRHKALSDDLCFDGRWLRRDFSIDYTAQTALI